MMTRTTLKRGRGECRVSDAPVVWAKNARVVPQVHRNHPAFPAQWFYGFLRALPGDRALLPPSLADNSADLTPASGCQDHTTSPSALVPFVHGTSRVHRIPPRVDDVAQRPSVGGTLSQYSENPILSSIITKFRNQSR